MQGEISRGPGNQDREQSSREKNAAHSCDERTLGVHQSPNARKRGTWITAAIAGEELFEQERCSP